jgi:hypothetical protein
MLSTLFRKKTARKSASTKGFCGFRPQCEALEDRLVMTTLAGTVPGSTALLPPAQAVNLALEPRDLITGDLTSANKPQVYSFQLQQGDYLQAEVRLAPIMLGATTKAKMIVMNSSGAVLDTSNPNTAYGFRAPTGGTYYAEVTGSVAGSIFPAGYQLELHRLALAQGAQSVATLAQTGSMYAFLSGNTLDITGPTGYGFGISGNWTQTTITGIGGMAASTYTATGTLELQSAAGPISLGIGAGQVATVTTAAQVNGQVFGAVSGLNIPATINTGPLVAEVASVFGFNLNPIDENVTIDLTIGGASGIALGNNNVVQATQAPVNSAIPYVYFTLNPLGTPGTNILSVVCDPADPALYLEGKAVGMIPLGPVSVNGIGLSKNGLIPYTPLDAPSQYTGKINSGNLVLQGSVETTAITAIPSEIDGSITLNFDPEHTGQFFGGASVTAADVASVFSSSYASVLGASNSPLVQDLSQVFRNLTIGVNGTLQINPFASFQQDASWWVGNEILSLPTGPNSFLDQALNAINSKLAGPQNLAALAIGHGSLVYDGPSESFYFRGGTANPLAGTPLATLAPVYTYLTKLGTLPTLDLDVAVKPGGEFFLDLTSTYNLVGLPDSSQLVLAHDYPVTGPATRFLSPTITGTLGGIPAPVKAHSAPLYTGVYLDANVSVLGDKVELQGTMAGNGDFTLMAEAQVNLGPLTGSASIIMTDTHTMGFTFTANLDASFSTRYIKGGLDAQISFGVANNAVTYAGSVTAWGDVYIPIAGWVGGSLSGGISNNYIWVSVDGYSVDINL